MKKIILALSVLAVLFAVSCSDKATEPEVKSDPIDTKYDGTYERASEIAFPGVPKTIILSNGSIIQKDSNGDELKVDSLVITKVDDTTYKSVAKPDAATTVTATFVFSGTSGSYKFTLNMEMKSTSYEGNMNSPYEYNQQP